MAAEPSISLIFPAYNEAGRIKQTVQEAIDYFASRDLDYEVIVVAEGDDGTREAVAEMGVANSRLQAMGDRERRGKGRAIRQAVARAEKDVIGFADADNKTPIDELDKLLPLLRDGYDLAIGSRKMGASRIEHAQKAYRRVGSQGFRLFMQLAVGLRGIPDTQCGFKFFRREVAKALFARQRIDGYMFDVEILYLAQKAGFKVAQVPIRWRDDGDSRLQLLSGNLRNVRDILTIRLTHRNCAFS